MKVKLVALAAVLVLTAAGMAGFIAWRLHGHQQERPYISVFTRGTLIRVGPYQYCDKNDLNRCDPPGRSGELTVDDVAPVQLSIDSEIAKAPWMLARIYADPNTPQHQQARSDMFRDHRSAVTIPTLDDHGRRLVGLEVRLATVGLTNTGEEIYIAHAVWSVATNWAR